MYYGEIKNCDIANGVGVRVTLFVSGCTNHCKNCFQPQTWDFCFGEEFTEEVEERILKMLAPDYIDGLTVLGGEPMEPNNQEAVYEFILKVKERFPNKTVWVFSGFTYEELLDENAYPHTDVTEKILDIIDVLVDGRFKEELKDITLRFRGSSNQRLIDMKKTRRSGEIVLWDDKKA